MTASEVCSLRPISEVFVELGGSPPRHGRARAFYRDGDNQQAVSFDDSKGCWYDHRDGKGGGVLDLVQRVRGGSRAEALRHLAELSGVTLEDRPTTAAERRGFAKRARDADVYTQRVMDWASGLLSETEGTVARETAEALSAGIDPTAMLARLHQLAHRLRSGTAHDLVGEYGRALAADEAEVARLQAVGRDDREDAERVTWAVVDILARSQARDQEAA
jgi:hypothetical protein